MIRVGLLGGSFNPAHRGHRRASLAAIRALGLDEVWWLVSPGNPLKANRSDMAPPAVRLASARRMSRRAPIRATAIEARLGTRYTADTLVRLKRQFPRHRFIWLMGADNIAEFHRWRDWRRIARTLPIAILPRPGYGGIVRAGVAAGWLRRFVRPAATAGGWTTWRPPALVPLRSPLDRTSSTSLRGTSPSWQRAFAPGGPAEPRRLDR